MRWVFALLVCAMLAGCSEEAAPEEELEQFDDIELEATDDTGVIRGLVLDATITPIMDAIITLEGTGFETTSNDGGAFGFSDLEPGTYFMTIDKLGYGSVQQSATVVAGVQQPEIVKVLLEADPSELPFVLELQWNGHMACGLSALALCGLPVVDDATGDDFLHVFELDQDGVTYLQSEAIWDTTTSVSPNMQLWQQAQGTGGCTFDAQNGGSPNVINTTFGDYNTHGNKECFQSLGNTTNLYLRMFAGSIDGTFPPTEDGCYPPIGLCMGIGATLDQPFEVFNHLFYGYKPADGWQFSNSAAPPPPQ